MTAVFLPLAILRLVGGLGMLIGVAVFGYYARPLWVLPVLAVIFTISYGLGKWRAWVDSAQNGTLGKSIVGQGGTFVVQLILVAILYFIGRGVGSLVGFETVSAELGQSGWTWLAWFAAFATATGLGIMLLDKKARTDSKQPQHNMTEQVDFDAPEIDPTPLTEATFWNRHHYSNQDHVYDDARETVLNKDRAYLSDTAIAAEEVRLGVALPALLRRLYARQNGGGNMMLWVPCDKPIHNAEGGWINPFSGYDDMLPITAVETLHGSISAYADDDEIEMFPTDSKAMIVLARWYNETLFLDYRGRRFPRVGFVDFGEDENLSTGDWENDALWWDDFDAFFAELRAEADR